MEATIEGPRGARLAALYALFAAASFATNMVVQATANAVYHGPFHVALAMVAGTAAGIVPKYLLDRRWIFVDQTPVRVTQFSLYSLMAVAPTLLFWTVELLFNRFGHAWQAKYLGAAVGLSLGYWAKYQLDRRFVFAGRTM